MSLDPSPLSPTPTPLLSPTDPVPGRGAAAMGAGISLVLAILVAFVSLRFGTQILYIPQGIKAHTTAWTLTRPFQIQGFNYQWAKSYGTGAGVGYDATSTNTNIFTNEATQYHMNLVVITITADEAGKANPTIVAGSGSADGYADDVYSTAAKAALKAGLTPIFKLALRVVTPGTANVDPWSGTIGTDWGGAGSSNAQKEQIWFNNYTAFAVQYAQLAQKLGMPFLIIGSELDHLTVDTSATGAGAPNTGDTFTCKAGRRDCEWRHVAAAIRNATYVPYGSATPTTGGGFVGKLIYAATSRLDPQTIGLPEWDNITWWDAVDYIGIDAFFPLSGGDDPSSTCIQDAWQGKSDHCGSLASPNQPDVFDEMVKLSAKFSRPIIFTSVGYESVNGSNKTPGLAVSTNPDQPEQNNDMQGLLQTFQPQNWWLGAIWSYDFAVWPRVNLHTVVEVGAYPPFDLDFTTQENDWMTNSEWAGDCLTATTSNGNCSVKDNYPPAKSAGVMLNHTYQVKPIPPLAAIG